MYSVGSVYRVCGFMCNMGNICSMCRVDSLYNVCGSCSGVICGLCAVCTVFVLDAECAVYAVYGEWAVGAFVQYLIDFNIDPRHRTNLSCVTILVISWMNCHIHRKV